VKFLLPFALLIMVGHHVLAPVAPRIQAPGLMRIAPVTAPFSGADPVLVMQSAAIVPARQRIVIG